jgi:hypothetical protein
MREPQPGAGARAARAGQGRTSLQPEGERIAAVAAIESGDQLHWVSGSGCVQLVRSPDELIDPADTVVTLRTG